jgi:hypothetical protein
MKLFIRFFFFHHILIAICAAALCVQTKLFYFLFDYPLTLIAFVFFATLLSYNVHFTFAARKSTSTDQLLWFHQTKIFTVVFNLLTLFATLWFWWKIKEITPLIILSVFINATYTAPLLLKKPIQLPSYLTFIKSYFIGFVWSYATVVLPLAFFHVKPEINEVFLFVSRLFLVALATMIFDYRDKLRDFESGVHTPANFMNEKQFTIFFLVNTVIYFFTVVFLSYRFHNWMHLLQIIPGVVLVYLLKLSKKQDSDLFYLGWVDGVLILSCLLSLFLLI